jgi:AcrR family transcriptional regulator
MGGGGWRYPSPAVPGPVPTQQRAAETIRVAIDATVELLEQLAEQQVTLDAIRRRSGVSQGSLTHHFASRDGLVATAQVERYSRACAADEAFLGRFAGRLDGPEPFASTLIGHITAMLTPERREVRWIRMSAIAAAIGDAALAQTLSSRYSSLIDRVSEHVEEGARHHLLLPDVDTRTVALLLSMQAQGLVLDDLVGHDVPEDAWNRMMVRFVACFLAPAAAEELERLERAQLGDLWRAEVFGDPGRVPSGVVERLGELRRTVGDAGTEAMTEPSRVRALLVHAEQGQVTPGARRTTRSTSEARDQLLRATMTNLRAHGRALLDISGLREATGITPQAFHRMYGNQDTLVREARIELELSRAAHSTARFARIVQESSDPAEFRSALERDALWMADDASRSAMWQRIETLAASRNDAELRASLARVQRTGRDLLIEQVCLAQTRGLIDPELPSRGVARFLDGTVFWHVFHGLDDRRPSREDWTAMLRRIALLLSPDRTPQPTG